MLVPRSGSAGVAFARSSQRDLDVCVAEQLCSLGSTGMSKQAPAFAIDEGKLNNKAAEAFALLSRENQSAEFSSRRRSKDLFDRDIY